jgi:hypothetical protein
LSIMGLNHLRLYAMLSACLHGQPKLHALEFPLAHGRRFVLWLCLLLSCFLL